MLFIWRESETVGTKILGKQLELPILQQVNACEGEFLLGVIVSVSKTGCRIGKVKRPVGLVDKVVGTIKSFALVLARQHGAPAILFQSDHLAIAMRTIDDSAMRVQRDSVGTKKGNHRESVV